MTTVSYPSPGVYHPPKPATPTLTRTSPLHELTKTAYEVIKRHIAASALYETPTRHSRTLPGHPYLKLECEQVTHSFKPRGALNKLETLCDYAGVVTASTGNHALATAHAARVYNTLCTVFVPRGTTERKMAALRAGQVEVRLVEGDCLTAELAAREFGNGNDLPYISPYNDLEVAAGQGTLGHELISQLGTTPRTVYITVGGGGLIAGVSAALKPYKWTIVGCQPARSAVMLRAVEAGRVVEVEVGETLSDGSAGGVEEGCVTLEYCAELVDRWVVVSEAQIEEGMRVLEGEDLFVEGAAGVAVAGYLTDSERSGEAVVVLCGGNGSKR